FSGPSREIIGRRRSGFTMRPGKRALSNCRWFQFPKVSGAGEGLSKKWGPRLGSGAGVVFTPAPGVIHPCFPLRGRWERPAKSDKQAPFPSLVALYSFVNDTRQRRQTTHSC